MKIFCRIISFTLILAAAEAGAQWPERAVTLVASSQKTLDFRPDIPDARAGILHSLVPRLSRELGVPVNLVFRPEGAGVLAANMLAGARPDGYVFGALGADTAMGRVIQGFTPYGWAELVPVSIAWRSVYALIARADDPASDILNLPRKYPGRKPRLAHTGLEPIEFSTLMAVRAASAAGFSWDFVEVETLSPDHLLKGEADAMVLPLGALKHYQDSGKLKVITVFSRGEPIPCARGLATLSDQNLDIEINPPFAFYLPAKVNWRIRERLAGAIQRAFQQPNLARAMEEACLEPISEEPEWVSAVMGQEYRRQEEILARFRN